MTEEESYSEFISSLKDKIRQSRQRAVIAVNTELLSIYWHIGHTILEQQKLAGWGKKITFRLAADLKMEFPDMKGFSQRNLVYMQTFAAAWPNYPFTQEAPAQLLSSENQGTTIAQAALAQLSWYHHTTILDKIKDSNLRIFYVQKTIENGWSRNILVHQIESQLHLRQGNAITNFTSTLPKRQSDLATEVLKSPYLFGFLSMEEGIQERDLEKGLIEHIKKFMLELGRGFAYVGNQYNLKVDGDDYFLDLLFYNYHLHCFIVFELKVGEFKPEYTGKLNFYINTINAQIRGVEDKASIGVLLCRTPNKTVVQYSLQSMSAPIGVSEYELTNILPKQLKGEMPTIEELENEIEKEAAILKKPIDEKKDQLQFLLQKIKGEEIKVVKSFDQIMKLYSDVVGIVKKYAENILHDVMKLFVDGYIGLLIDHSSSKDYTSFDLEQKAVNGHVQKIGIHISLNALKAAGTKSFRIRNELVFDLHDYKYMVSEGQGEFWGEYLYHHEWSQEALMQLTEKWCALIIEDINANLERVGTAEN